MRLENVIVTNCLILWTSPANCKARTPFGLVILPFIKEKKNQTALPSSNDYPEAGKKAHSPSPVLLYAKVTSTLLFLLTGTSLLLPHQIFHSTKIHTQAQIQVCIQVDPAPSAKSVDSNSSVLGVIDMPDLSAHKSAKNMLFCYLDSGPLSRVPIPQPVFSQPGNHTESGLHIISIHVKTRFSSFHLCK